MDLSEVKILRLINRLLERLHQADGEKNSSHITLNYIAPGAQYVNHIDTQVFDSAKLQKPPQDNHINQNTTKLPDCLATKEAMLLWKSAMDKGWVDENYQPTLCTNYEIGLLAEIMARYIGLKKQWAVFGKFWNIDRGTLRSAYNKALDGRQYYDLYEKLNKQFAAK